MGKMNYAKAAKAKKLSDDFWQEKDKLAHKKALRKAWALWKAGKGPKPVWNIHD